MVIEKFLRYIAVDTQSSETSGAHPSTEKQKGLGRMLTAELEAMHAESILYDEEHNYVYAAIPATADADEVVGFIAHMDTSPETSGTDVRPQFVRDYDGSDIPLGPAVRGSGDAPLVLSPKQFPELLEYKGKTFITTDGSTLLGADVAYTVDGGALGEIEYETFNAAAATVTVKGVTVHPGEAKGKMVNAAAIAAEFHCALPADQVPEKTEGREGFFYLCEMKGETEAATLQYIIRDHDRGLFEEKKQLLRDLEAQFNETYGAGVVTVTLKDQYYNMREKIDPDYLYLVDRAADAMKALGITPLIQPIRGGTDGASLSFRGLPCPNLCAGGHNFHGRYEYVPVESMEKIVELLLRIATK